MSLAIDTMVSRGAGLAKPHRAGCGGTERLRAMAARVPAGLIDADRRLAQYACATGALQGR